MPPRLAGWPNTALSGSVRPAVTERVRLLSHVAVVALRHPLLTAKQYATLDHLSADRLILGVGAGHVREEFEALGVDTADDRVLTSDLRNLVERVRQAADIGFPRITADDGVRLSATPPQPRFSSP